MTASLEMNLTNLRASEGSRKTRVRRGRGTGSGLGKQAGRGGKGQTARSGKGRPKGFEGGQMPLCRRLPKFGFKNSLRKTFETINVSSLDSHFKSGDTVEPQTLVERGILAHGDSVKILGQGNLTQSLTVKAHRFSKSAIQKINQAGGRAEEIKIGSS